MVLDQAWVVRLAACILGEDPEALEDLEPDKDGQRWSESQKVCQKV